MRNYKTVIMLLLMISFAISSIAQSPAPGTKREVHKNGNANTSESERSRFSSSASESINYIEIKLVKTNNGTRVRYDEKSLEGDAISSLSGIDGKLTDIFKLVERSNASLATELGKNGFKIISHSFSMLEEQEIHFYIIEL